MAIYDTYDTVPVRGVDPDSEDSPLLAVKAVEDAGLGPDQSIVGTFTPDEKKKLLQMIKNGEFSQLEGAILKMLMSECATLEDLGAMIGAVSRRTKGNPMTKNGAKKELNRILALVAKRSKAKFGKAADLNQIRAYNREMKKVQEWRKRKASEARRYANSVENEFKKLLRELHAVQREKGIAPSRYYVRYFAPHDADISKMKKFGGTPDEHS